MWVVFPSWETNTFLDRWLVHSYTQLRMKTRSALLYAGSAWQLLRFILLTLFIFVALYPEMSPSFMILYIWSGVAQCVIAIGFFFLARDEKSYLSYRNLLVLGKVLDAVPGIILFILQIAAIHFGLGEPLFLFSAAAEAFTLGQVETALLFHYLLVGIVLFDLIFLLVLISLRLTPPDSFHPASNHLPEYSEEQLEDET